MMQIEKKALPEEPSNANAGPSDGGLQRKLSRKQEKAPEGQEPHQTEGEVTVAVNGEQRHSEVPGPDSARYPTFNSHPSTDATPAGGEESSGIISKFRELIV